MVCVCFAPLPQLQLLSVRRRTEGCSTLYGHRDQGNVLDDELNFLFIQAKKFHQNGAIGSFSITKPGNCILRFVKLSSKVFFTARVPILFRNKLTLTLIEFNNLLRSVLTSPALVLRVNVVFCFSSLLAVFRRALPGLGRDVRGRHGSWQEQRRCQQLHQAAVLPQTQPSWHCRYLGRGETKSLRVLRLP